MPAPKYLRQVAGVLMETLGLQVSTGVADADKIVATNGDGKIDVSLIPAGFGVDVETIATTEALIIGDYVNIYNSTGRKVRKASGAAGGFEANGFVLAAVANGANATVYLRGSNTGQTGLTAGEEVYLSPTTPGRATATIPTGAGQLVQRLGKASSATANTFEYTPAMGLA